MKMLRATATFLVFAMAGLLAFFTTALMSGESSLPAWEREGAVGVVLWAYERGSAVTVVVLFLLALVCGWLMPFSQLLAAISLALFYPAFAILRIVFGSHTGNLIPFEFLGYLMFIAICLFGYAMGRWLSRRALTAHCLRR